MGQEVDQIPSLYNQSTQCRKFTFSNFETYNSEGFVCGQKQLLATSHHLAHQTSWYNLINHKNILIYLLLYSLINIIFMHEMYLEKNSVLK